MLVIISSLLASSQINYREWREWLDTKKEDSVSLKVLRIKTTKEGQHVIWLKDEATKQRYITICECKPLPAGVKKGATIKIPASRLVIIKDSFTKQDLEN